MYAIPIGIGLCNVSGNFKTQLKKTEDISSRTVISVKHTTLLNHLTTRVFKCIVLYIFIIVTCYVYNIVPSPFGLISHSFEIVSR